MGGVEFPVLTGEGLDTLDVVEISMTKHTTRDDLGRSRLLGAVSDASRTRARTQSVARVDLLLDIEPERCSTAYLEALRREPQICAVAVEGAVVPIAKRKGPEAAAALFEAAVDRGIATSSLLSKTLASAGASDAAVDRLLIAASRAGLMETALAAEAAKIIATHDLERSAETLSRIGYIDALPIERRLRVLRVMIFQREDAWLEAYYNRGRADLCAKAPQAPEVLALEFVYAGEAVQPANLQEDLANEVVRLAASFAEASNQWDRLIGLYQAHGSLALKESPVDAVYLRLASALYPAAPAYVDERKLRALRDLATGFADLLSTDSLLSGGFLLSLCGRSDDALAVLRILLFRTPSLDELHKSRSWYDLVGWATAGRVALSPDRSLGEIGHALLEATLIAAGGSDEARGAVCAFLAVHLLQNYSDAAKLNVLWRGLHCLELTDLLRLSELSDRVYSDQTRLITWPAMGGRPWPFYTLRPTAFEAGLPAGAEWPKITVVTPSYNQGEFIEETILSVLNQNYPNLEYIIVDACSNDGTASILSRYRPLVSKVIIEPDEGQTDAINKGLRLATGELVTWLNSDDMFAPGALHALALARLRSEADILFGYCLSHRTRAFQLVNLPKATNARFNPALLGDIFGSWMKGEFFYQPEVAFTSALVNKVGLLDQSLYYTMDYDFWVRASAAGAKVDVIKWPIALFRQHDKQKTARLDRCVLEQAVVRDRSLKVEIRAWRQLEVDLRRRRLGNSDKVRVGVVSSRRDKIFSADAARSVAAMSDPRHEFEFAASCIDLSGPKDLYVKLCHLQCDEDDIARMRRSSPDALVAGWFWDNHHHVFKNHAVARALDVIIPGHAFASAYLANTEASLEPELPLCVTQWSEAEARSLFTRFGMRPRSDELYGGFVRYPFAAERNRLVDALIKAGFPDIRFLEESKLGVYFSLSAEERFSQWTTFKTSLCLPLYADLSQRFFDALLCGQVPVVSSDIADLPMLQADLAERDIAVVVFDRYTPDAVFEAHRQALHMFDSQGLDGVKRRHDFGMEHLFERRLTELVRRLAG